MRIFHREVLVARTCATPQTRQPATPQQRSGCGRAAAGPGAPPTGWLSPGWWTPPATVSFAGTNYRVGNRWRGRSAQVCIVAGSVQLSCDGQIVRVHPIRHDRAKEHGAFATPNGRPRHRQDAPAGAGVKATPLRGRPTGRALTPTP